MLPERKTLLKLISILCVAFIMIVFAGCSAQKTEYISIGTGGTGGTYYPYGGAMASIINKHVEGFQATAEVTGASVENIRLLESGEAQLVMAMNDVVYHALNGKGAFEKPVEVRTLFEMYPNVFHAVTLKNSNIKTMQDLVGKKVSVGAPGSGTETMSNLVLDSLGISYDEFEVFRLSFSENTQGLKDGVIDVGIWSVGPPTSSIMDLATTHKIRILSFTDEEINKVTEKHPYYSSWKLEPGTYSGQEEEVITPAVWNTVVVHKDMSEETAYKLVKAIFENADELVDVYVGAKNTTPENTIKNAVAPLHPGVIKYFKELGLEVPDKLIPPEMK